MSSKTSALTGIDFTPLIEVKAFDHQFEDDDTAARLIARLTDAFVDVYGEEVRAKT